MEITSMKCIHNSWDSDIKNKKLLIWSSVSFEWDTERDRGYISIIWHFDDQVINQKTHWLEA